MTSCLICGSSNLKKTKTKMSDFLVAKIYGEDAVSTGIEVNLCYCDNCSFSFYDKRLTDNEEVKLYSGYRGEDYQSLREKYECWYTKKVNEAMNNDETALREQQRVILKMMQKFINKPIRTGLDFGGNHGSTFCEDFQIQNQYVYDVSGVETISGVYGISSFEELRNFSFDFIMCNMTLEHVMDPFTFTKTLYDIGGPGTYYYVEVPSESPFCKNKFSISKNIELLFNPTYDNFKLIKYYLEKRKQPYMPMHEHVNFFTPKSLRALLEKTGLKVLDVQENFEKAVLGKSLVLSAFCKK